MTSEPATQLTVVDANSILSNPIVSCPTFKIKVKQEFERKRRQQNKADVFCEINKSIIVIIINIRIEIIALL